ncbi:DNA polymerase III subunit alpha [bacterium]|nr:DNA polymerase III subunit alpha [bacterium]MCI0604639.1 DNA polymerase III subunit alpha [bacterium]
MDFTHLHLHSDYSLLDGACKIEKLIDKVQLLGMNSVALTDHGNLFGAVEFHDIARKKGIKPIIGCEMYVAPASRLDKTGKPSDTEENNFHLVVLAENNEGYQNLVRLVSRANLEGYYYKPRVDKELLAEYHKGLIVLSGCLSGEVAVNLLNGNFDGAMKVAGEYREIFGAGNYFLEIQDHGLGDQLRINPQLVQMASRLEIPLVATNDSHYIHKEDAHAHDVLLCIQTNRTLSEQNRMRFGTNGFYIKSPEEMMHVFRELPQSIHTAGEIGKRCDVDLRTKGYLLPLFPVPEGYTPAAYFERIVREGYKARLPKLEKMQEEKQLRHQLWEYEQRLAMEISVIQQMGFEGYFLITWDFIKHSKEQNIPVGPGRGSAAGSLVAYCLQITDIDPLQYDLLFERFLNPERISMPDIDIDFCGRRRGEVIDYVTQRYGRENVAQIITYNTLAARVVTRDVGRAMEFPYSQCDKLAKMIPNELHISLDSAIQNTPALQEAIKDQKVQEWIDIAKKLEGLVRNASIHAGGVVIAPKPLMELVPLFRSKEDVITTQYDMKVLERLGLLKMDFLGVATFTILDDTLQYIREYLGKEIRLLDIPLNDPKVYQLFTEGKTNGVFQFESSGMKALLRKFKPERFEDLIMLNALFRPGPMQMLEDCIARKHGKVKIQYLLPQLEPFLKETYGIIVYQEQVMQIASKIGGFSLGEADLLRRAMGKKKMDVMQAQRERFVHGAKERSIDASKAAELFDLMEKFAQYGFNKSHSTAYALVAYQTAYLKTYYPEPFLAALLSSQIDRRGEVVRYFHECRDMGIRILPPNINDSGERFSVEGDTIRFGLAAIKNVGAAAIQSIAKAREQGKFESLEQFYERVDTRAVNKRVVESLIKSGAMDSFQVPRKQLIQQLDHILEDVARKERHAGQATLFDLSEVRPVISKVASSEDFLEQEKLAHEKETLGFYISGHPLHKHKELLETYTTSLENIDSTWDGKEVLVGGIIGAIKQVKTRKGDFMAYLELEDLTGMIEITVFPELFRNNMLEIMPEAELIVRGRLEVEEETRKLIASDVIPMKNARELLSQQLKVHIYLPGMENEKIDRLKSIVEQYRGDCNLVFVLKRPEQFVASLSPSPVFRVRPSRDFVFALEQLLGPNCVEWQTGKADVK